MKGVSLFFSQRATMKNTSLYLNRTLNASGDLTCDSQTTIRTFGSVVLTDSIFTCNSMTNGSVALARVAVQGNTFVEGTVHSDNSTFEGHTSLVRQAFGSITVGPKGELFSERLVVDGLLSTYGTVQGEITATTVHSHGSVFQSSNVSFLEGQFWGDTTVKGSKISSSKVYQVNVIL